MSVIMMCGKEEGVLSEHWTKVAKSEIYLKTTYVGKVVAIGERNGYHDSDFYCTVYDEEADTFKTFEYGTTRAWAYPNNAFVDADDDLMKKYAAWKRKMATLAIRMREWMERDKVCKGDEVKVVAGRKVPKDTTGKVFWVGKCKFSGNDRIGFNDNEGNTHWTVATNVSRLVDGEEIRCGNGYYPLERCPCLDELKDKTCKDLERYNNLE